MTLLAIDTATVSVSVAIVRDGAVVGSFSSLGARRQTEIVHPAIALLLTSAGLVPGDLDGVVADVGPGRFTGVRVGLAAAKALAFAAGAPIAGFTSAEILIEGTTASDDVIAVVDLRRGEVAVGFGGDGADALVRTTPDALGLLLVEQGRTGALLVGDGAVEYRAAIESAAGCPLDVDPEMLAPSAIAACRLAERRGVFGDPMALEAIYLRGADVRLGWATRDGAAAPTRLEVG